MNQSHIDSIQIAKRSPRLHIETELLLQVAPKVNFMNEDIDELRNLAALILHGQGTFGIGL